MKGESAEIFPWVTGATRKNSTWARTREREAVARPTGEREPRRRRSAREDRRLDSGLRERANETSLGAVRKDEGKGVIGVVDLCVCAYIKERERERERRTKKEEKRERESREGKFICWRRAAERSLSHSRPRFYCFQSRRYTKLLVLIRPVRIFVRRGAPWTRTPEGKRFSNVAPRIWRAPKRLKRDLSFSFYSNLGNLI